MAKGKSGARGGRGGRDRGGGGRGRGNNGRGRGGGWAPQGPGRGRGHSHSGSNSSRQDELDDFTLQTYANAPSPLKPVPPEPSGSRGRGIPPFRGRGRGGPHISNQLSANIIFPRRFDIPRRHVQGIGVPKDARRAPVPVGAKQTLSNLLSQERPLLKPIVFVPSTEARFLFQDEEELLQPIMEDVDKAIRSPIPTADRVTRVFSGGIIPPDIWDNAKDSAEDDIEVVDFNDVGKLFSPTASTSKTAIPKRETNFVPVESTEERITRIGIQETPPLPPKIKSVLERIDKPLSVPNGTGTNDSDVFYVDTQPSNVPNGKEFSTIQQLRSVLPDDDIVVYPRTSGREKESTNDVTEASTANGHGREGVDIPGILSYERPAALPTSVSYTQPESTISITGREPLLSVAPTTFTTPHIPEPPLSILTLAIPPDTAETTNSTTVTGTPTRLRVPPITTPRQAKLWKSKLSRTSKGAGTSKSLGKTPFSAFGNMRAEGLLRKLDGERDERYNERRRGDSDLEWGDATDDDGEDVVGVGKEVGDMNAQEQKPALDADMKRVLGMLENGKEKPGENLKQASHNIDNDHGMEVDVDVDIESMERFVKGLTGADAGTYVTIDDIEYEELMRMEDEGDGDVKRRVLSGTEDEGTEDEGEEKALRVEEAKFMLDGKLDDAEDTDDTDDDLDLDDEDEDEDDFEDSSFQFKLNRLRSKGVAVNRDSEDGDGLFQRTMTSADRDEVYIRYLNVLLDEKEDLDDDDLKHLDSYSDYKILPPELAIQFELDRQKKAERKRERELNRLASGADPLSKKKGGRKGRKAMLAAAAADPTITVLPNRVIDTTTLVQNIRRFIADLGGPPSMSLPPADKETRKNVHEIALAFNLKSVSKGKGDARYITLIKTTKTGIKVDEGKLARIVRRSGMLEDKKGKGVLRVPRHKEGDVVGMAAPRLNDSNVGFRLLAMMGWSEGDRIGASTNGLEAPLHAIIKTSKLGLGARK